MILLLAAGLQSLFHVLYLAQLRVLALRSLHLQVHQLSLLALTIQDESGDAQLILLG